MDLRDFGTTGLRVPALGLGAGALGDEALSDADAERLVHASIDAGVTLLDTAPSYGCSEERVGRALGGRRDAVVLSTKVGYGVPGRADWTCECVRDGIRAALARLRTDVLDVVLLHSCPRDVLERGDVVDALERARDRGEARVIGYSGENDALEWAIASGRFGGMMASINVCDQRVLDGALPRAKDRGMGVLAKRPVANAPWRYRERPAGSYAEAYWERLAGLGLDFGAGWQEIALRFSAFTWGVDTCVVGTSDVGHLLENVRIVERGPLPAEIVGALREAFRRADRGWTGQI